MPRAYSDAVLIIPVMKSLYAYGIKSNLKNEMRMVRQICAVKLSDKVACEELRDRLGLEDVLIVLQRNRLRWFGHVFVKKG